jgi:DNA-binding response OmpR family regulator
MNERKILIVEDDDELRLGMGIRLKSAGYNVVEAADGVTAISVAQREKPDLVLLDLGLPAGDGFVVLERMKSLVPLAAIPVIVLSARDPATNRENARRSGALAFFQKPVENKTLLAAVRAALGMSGAGSRDGAAGESRL